MDFSAERRVRDPVLYGGSQSGFPPELQCREAKVSVCCSGYLLLQRLAGSRPSRATNETCGSRLPAAGSAASPVSVVTAFGSAKTR